VNFTQKSDERALRLTPDNRVLTYHFVELNLFVMKFLTLVPLLLLSVLGTSPGEESVNSLLPNGNCEEGGIGTANGWPAAKGVSIVEEDGNHFLRLEAVESGKQIQAYRKLMIPGGTQKLKVSFRVRFAAIKPGAESWHTGRLVMHFKDASGQILKPDPAPFAFKGDSNGWVEKSVELNVPEGAVALEFMPALFQVAQGTLDLDDMAAVPE